MKKRFHILVTLPIFILLGSTLFFLVLPYLFDLYVFPRLMAELSFTEKELSLSRLSPWKIRGTLTLADVDRPTLTVPKFELYYTPRSLLQRKIAGLLLDSASIQVEIKGGHPVIRGLPSDNFPATQKDNPSPFLLPLAVETIILKNCAITLHRGPQKPINIIVDGRFTLDFLEQSENKKLLSTLSGQILAAGDLALSGKIGLKSVDNEYEVQLQLQAPDISLLSALSPDLKDAQLTGGLTLNAQIAIDRLNNRITRYEATAQLPGFRLRKNDFILENSSAEKPVTLQLTGTPDKAQYTLANIAMTKPEKATLNMRGEIIIPVKTFSGIGQIFFERTISAVKIDLNGDNLKSTTSINFQLAGDAFNLEDTFSCSSFKANGNIDIDGSTIAGNLSSLIPEMTLKKSGTTLVNLSLQLPFQYPPLSTSAAGDLKIEQIRYQGINSGRLQATLLPSPEGITFTTLFTTPFIPDLRLTCDGSAQLSTDISAHCRLPATKIDSATFPRFIPLPDKLSFKSKLAAIGEFHITDKVPTGKVTVDYHEGTLNYGENKLSDINFGVVFPHLPLLQSGPSQLCTIGALDFGKIKLSDARIRFRIEDEQSVFLEKIRASWCGGKVETGSFTLAGNMKELETTLYCDRLGFTELLSQFGIDKTEGQGSLNGRLPLLISRQGLVFDDGFLFSTPGNSGIVRFNDTKKLRQGMPGINGSAYLDYSMEALENFSYNWAKLSFNSQKTDLLIAMQLDGKPSEPLPFGYKNGQIVPSSEGPGLQHPIRLDVNFRLPLQDLFQYGKNIQSIMENM